MKRAKLNHLIFKACQFIKIIDKTTNMKKQAILTSISIIFTILLISLVSADFWACFEKGQEIDFCNPKVPDRTASSNGYSVCMKEYNSSGQCFNQGSLGKCNQNGACSFLGGNTSFDITPPELTINSPAQDGIYTSRSVLVDFDLDEKADVYYYDNINGKVRLSRLCNDCSPGSPSYSRKKSFKEGFNDISFIGIDVVGNQVYVNRTFIVDSKKPKIHRTEPRSDYASGLFEIQYSEENLEEIRIFYGNEKTGFRNAGLENCIPGEKQWCSIDVNLEDYDGGRIEYYFIIKDIAENEKKSQIRQNLNVDTTFPVLNNPLFWNQGTGKYSRYVYFNFDVTEKNLDKIEYMDNSDNKPRWKTLCSRLKDGICETKKSFSRGNHSVDIQITDKAGNSIGYSTGEFNVEY